MAIEAYKFLENRNVDNTNHVVKSKLLQKIFQREPTPGKMSEVRKRPMPTTATTNTENFAQNFDPAKVPRLSPSNISQFQLPAFTVSQSSKKLSIL